MHFDYDIVRFLALNIPVLIRYIVKSHIIDTKTSS